MISKIKEKLFKKPLKTKETVMEFMCSILGCWMVSVGICLILDSQFSSQIGLLSILWQTLAAVLAAVLFTRRWWIPIIYFGILVPVFFLAVAISGDINSFLQSAVSFVEWWASSMPINSQWYSDQGFYLVHTVINIGVGALFFTVARITKRSWAVVLLAFVFVIANYTSGYSGYDYLAIVFLVVGIFPLVAGEKFQKTKAAGQSDNFGILGKRWLLVAVSTVVAILVSTASLGIVTNIEGNVRTRFSSGVVADIQTATNTYTNEQKKLSISLFDLGLVTNNTYIGGSLYNIQPRIVATATLPEDAFVKITSFDTFDGENWTTDFKKGYRINGLWDEEQDSFLSSSLVHNEDYLKATEKVADKQKVTVTLAEDVNFLPTVGQVTELEENTPNENLLLYDELGRLLSYYGQGKGYTYTFEALVFNTDKSSSKKQIKKVLRAFGYEADPLYDPQSDFYKLYTKTFKDVPEELEKAVDNLDLEDLSEYEKAYKICKYFSTKNGFFYTEDAPNFKKGDNVISKLFKEKKGHCMYYATAMTVMARQAGVPARLAAGYRTVAIPDSEISIIDASQPYAWVECYIPHIGWLSFDPNPGTVLPSEYSESEYKDLYESSNIPKFEFESKPPKDNNSKRPSVRIEWDKTLNWSLILLYILASLFVVALVLNTVFSQKCYELSFVRRVYDSTQIQALLYYHDILRQLSWLGLRFKVGETISELVLRVREKTDQNDGEIVTSGMKTIEALQYGDVAPTQEDIDGIFEARQTLEKILRDKNNAVLYFIKRRLLLSAFDLKFLKNINFKKK